MLTLKTQQTLLSQLQLIYYVLQPLINLVPLHWIHSGVPVSFIYWSIYN